MSAANVSPALWTNEAVVLLRWPEQRAEAERMARLSIPRLLLVEPGTPPPPAAGCLEDWIRLPAEDADVRSRLEALVRRAADHPSVPTLNDVGELSIHGRRAHLSPIDERIARVLVGSFGEGVAEDEILRSVWADGGSAGVLSVHISRLRKRLAVLGLGISSIRGYGYRMHGPNPASIPVDLESHPAHE